MGTPSQPVPPRPDLGYGPAPGTRGATAAGTENRGPSDRTAGPGEIARPARRLGGYCFDALVMLPVVIAVLTIRTADIRAFVASMDPSTGQFSEEALLDLQRSLLPLAMGLSLITFVYATVLVAAWSGQTLGKRVAGTRIVRADDGAPVGWGPAAIRAAVPLAAAWIPGIGVVAVLMIYAWIFFNPRRQGLHDLAARTVVVNR